MFAQRLGHRAHGVVVSHPLRMRKALGSNPSVSIFRGGRNKHVRACTVTACCARAMFLPLKHSMTSPVARWIRKGRQGSSRTDVISRRKLLSPIWLAHTYLFASSLSFLSNALCSCGTRQIRPDPVRWLLHWRIHHVTQLLEHAENISSCKLRAYSL